MTRMITLAALIALGLSSEPVHEPVYAQKAPTSLILLLYVTSSRSPSRQPRPPGSAAPSPANKPGRRRRHGPLDTVSDAIRQRPHER